MQTRRQTFTRTNKCDLLNMDFKERKILLTTW